MGFVRDFRHGLKVEKCETLNYSGELQKLRHNH